MALAPIAPWLQPADALGAARGGAALGLQQREQNISRLNAIERTALAYAQLNAENQRAAMENDARAQIAAATLQAREQAAADAAAMRQQQFEARNELSQANLQARLAELGLSTERARTGQEMAAQRLELANQSLVERMRQNDVANQLANDKFDLAVQLAERKLSQADLSEEQKARKQMLLEDYKAAQRALAGVKLEENKIPAQARVDEAKAAYTKFLSEIGAAPTAAGMEPRAPAPALPTAAAALPVDTTWQDRLGAAGKYIGKQMAYSALGPFGMAYGLYKDLFPNQAPVAAPLTNAPTYTSADAVRAAFKAGTLTRAEAERILREQFQFSE